MKPSLLIVDDSPDIHSLLEVRLRPEGLKIDHAYGGDEGIRMAEALNPDLILLDVEMPEVSGFDVCRRLKSTAETSSIPIIFLTGAAEVETKVHGFDLGAVDYVTKPFEPAELRARVRAALRTKRYHDLLATRASIDGLTGLFTRACFDNRFGSELMDKGRPVSLVMIDVDHFKRINDTFGHPFGDRVLQATGELLGATRLQAETAYRYGGEEFVVVMPGSTLAVAEARAIDLKRRLHAIEFMAGRERLNVTASFGVASTELGFMSAADILEAADRALYASKAAGRDRVTTARAA